MNDFYYDVMQRKKLARAAKYVKRGSKSKKCTLPSDRLTKRQWEKRNGDVMTCNMNAPMDWEKFIGFSKDIQREYVNSLRHRYKASTKDFAEMFGVSYWKLRDYFNGELQVGTSPLGRRSESKENDWLNFVTMPEDNTGSEEEQEQEFNDDINDDVESVNDVIEEPDNDKPKMKMSSAVFCFSGPLNAEAIYNSIRTALVGSPEGTIRIEVQFK